MLLILVLIGLLNVVSAKDSTSTSPDNVDIFTVQVVSSSMGRIKYEDGEVVLYQNRLKPTDVFFTPFPRFDPANSECQESILSGHAELSLSVELYTPQLVQAIQAYLKRHFSTLCAGNETCDVSLLPMSAIRLVQKGRRTDKAREMYSINDEWHSNTLLLQSIKFVLYMANQSVCEDLWLSIVKRCYLPNFELHYSLHSEKTVEKQLEITTEQVTGTSMFNQIRSEFPSADTVVLTGGDFKKLISEVADRITMKLRVQEGFESHLQDPISLDRLLERQLQFKQVQLEKADAQLWDSLYWTRDLTRPDRLAKAINTVLRKNSTNANHFLYDSQAVKKLQKLGLTRHDIDRFEKLDKVLAAYARSSASSDFQSRDPKGHGGLNFAKFNIGVGISGGGSSGRQSESGRSENTQTTTAATHEKKINTNHLNGTNIESNNDTQYVLSRTDVENYLNELSDHIHLEGDLIFPKPIDAHLIKLSELQAKTKLVSHTVLVRTRSNIHVLPLRCPPPGNNTMTDNTTIWYPWLTDKVKQLTTIVNRLTDQLSEMKEHIAVVQKNYTDRMVEMKQDISEHIAKVQVDYTERMSTVKEHLLNHVAGIQQNFTDRVLESEINCINKIENFTELENRIDNLEKTTATNCQSGSVCMGLEYGDSPRNVVKNILFPRPFVYKPKLLNIGLTHLDILRTSNIRLGIVKETVTVNGFNVRFRSWDGSQTFQACVDWLACA